MQSIDAESRNLYHARHDQAMPNPFSPKEFFKQYNEMMRGLAEGIDSVASEYWPVGRKQPIGTADSHHALKKLPAEPRGIVTGRQAVRLIDIEHMQFLAAILDLERTRMARFKQMIARKGAIGILRAAAWIAGGSVPAVKEIKAVLEMDTDTDTWATVEADFRARCDQARRLMLERQAGRTKRGEPRPGLNVTHTRKIYSRRLAKKDLETLKAAMKGRRSYSR